MGLEYKVSLEDGVSGPAKAGAQSTRQMAEALGEAKLALSTYQAQLSRVKLIGDIEGYHKYSAAVAEARKEVYHLTDALGPLKTESKSVGETLKSVAEGVGLERLGEVALETGKRILEGVVDGLKEVVITAFEVTEANERMRASFEALGGEGAGEKVLAFVDDLAKKLPQSRTELAGWTKEIQALGITDLGQIRSQVLALASAQAIMGDEGAAAYKQLQLRIRGYAEAGKGVKLETRSLAELYRAGVTQNDIARAMGITTAQLGAELKAGTADATAFGNALTETLIAKGQKPLEAMGNELGTIKTKAIETFEHFFDGIDTSPLTEAFKSIVALGDQGEPSGALLKQGITGALNEVIKWLAEGVTQAELFFLDLEIGAVKSGVGLKDVTATLSAVSEGLKEDAKFAGELYDVMSGIYRVGSAINAFTSPKGVEDLLGGTKLGDDYAKSKAAPANADGGMVKPANGEAFASVAPGEYILPRRIVDLLRQPEVSNDNAAGGGGGVQIGELHITIQAPDGVKDATAMTASGISTALERLQLASGR